MLHINFVIRAYVYNYNFISGNFSNFPWLIAICELHHNGSWPFNYLAM